MGRRLTQEEWKTRVGYRCQVEIECCATCHDVYVGYESDYDCDRQRTKGRSVDALGKCKHWRRFVPKGT